MDTIKQKKVRKWGGIKAVTAGCAVLLCAIYIFTPSSELADKQLTFSKVQKGQLKEQVSGYGKLQSASNRMLTAQYGATVVNIFHKPGVHVKPDTIILQLENPELRAEMESARRSLNRQKGSIRQLILEQKAEKLAENRRLVSLMSELKAAEIELHALEKTSALGIVSNITFDTKKLDHERLSELVKLDKERMAQMILLHEEALNIQRELQAQLEADYLHLQRNYEQLNVTAGISGVLQSLQVEVGQYINAGEMIAVIGVEGDLLAEVRVSQSRAQYIQIGQEAIVDTRKDKIKGKVIRIDPVVEDNTVAVDIELLEELPASARPSMNVDSKIIVNKIDSALFIDKPFYAKPHTSMTLYKVEKDKQMALRSRIRFGIEVEDKIEIISGAKLNDTFIISDLTEVKKETFKL